MKATAEEKRKIARRITDVLLEVRETSESSGEFRALMERLVLLIDAAVSLGGTRAEVMAKLDAIGTFK